MKKELGTSIYLTDDLMKFYTLDEALSYAKNNKEVTKITEKEIFRFDDNELKEKVVWTRGDKKPIKESLLEKKSKMPPKNIKVKVSDLIKGKYISENDLGKVDNKDTFNDVSSKVGDYLDDKYKKKGWTWWGYVISVNKDENGKPIEFVCSDIEWDDELEEELKKGNKEKAKELEKEQDALYDDAEYCDDHNQPSRAVSLRNQASELQKKIDENKQLNEEYKLHLRDDLWDRIYKYPELARCVSQYIELNGESDRPGYLTDLCVYIRNLDVDEPEFFGWDEETADDFYSWGHNSRYANVFEPMLYSNFEDMIECVVDYLDGDLDESKKSKKKKKDKVRFVGDMGKEISFFNRAMGNNATADGGVGSVAVAESVVNDSIEEAAEKIFEILEEHEIYADVEPYDEKSCVLVGIDGDWKHGHLAADYLIKKLYPNCSIEEQVTREDGSDWYESVHYVYLNSLKEDKTINIKNPKKQREITIKDKEEDDLGHPIQKGLKGREGKLMSEGYDKDATDLFDEFVNSLEFYIIKNEDGTYSLRDQQEANLGDIESETYDDIFGIANRLGDSAYLEDYYLNYMTEDFEDIMEDNDIEDGEDFDTPYAMDDFIKLRDIDNWIDKTNPKFTEKFIDDVKDFVDANKFELRVFDLLLSTDKLSKVNLDEIAQEVDDTTRELGSQKMYEMTCYDKNSNKKINIINPSYVICSKKMLDKLVEIMNKGDKHNRWEFPVSEKQLWMLSDEEKRRVIKGDDDVEEWIWDIFYKNNYDKSEKEMERLEKQFRNWLYDGRY